MGPGSIYNKINLLPQKKREVPRLKNTSILIFLIFNLKG